MERTILNCDGCDADISESETKWTTHLVLHATIAMPTSGQINYDERRLEREIDRVHHFCNVRCLAHWAQGQLPTPKPKFQVVSDNAS